MKGKERIKKLMKLAGAAAETRESHKNVIIEDVSKMEVVNESRIEITQECEKTPVHQNHTMEEIDVIENSSTDKMTFGESNNNFILEKGCEVINETWTEITQESEKTSNHQNRTIEVADVIENSPVNQMNIGQKFQGFQYNVTSLLRPVRSEEPGPSYTQSPINSGESDVDLSDTDPSYNTGQEANVTKKRPTVIEKTSSSSSSSSSTSSDSSSDSSSSSSDSDSSSPGSDNVLTEAETAAKVGRKRKLDPENWKQNKVKKLRNSGKPYTTMSASKKLFSGRGVKSSCTDKCRLKCSNHINMESRLKLFRNFWQLSDLYKQRAFIGSCMIDIEPKYRYTNAENPRKYNKAYYFTVDRKKVRVCKTFFKNTLDITERMIETTKSKYDENGIVQEDYRGRHENHKKISVELVNDIKNHINSIPRIESHYLRATSSREYINGAKTIADLFKDFKDQQTERGKDTGKYCTYYKIFTTEFNLGFYTPKKDQCDLCMSFANATSEQKEQLKNQLEVHLKEKQLSRIEKDADRQRVSTTNKVVVYDLQAVMQCPNGDLSSFYYKSKLNCLNFTITELSLKDSNVQNRQRSNEYASYDKVNCYFWTEIDGKRGANEIGSCVFNYLENTCKDVEDNINVVFYSDNCCGQNKNKFITTLYLYAVYYLDNLQSITHKFLIKGHSQNEADNVHSLIEREIKKNLKAGPIYCPHQYIPLIKNAKKHKNPFTVHELTYDFFKDLKLLQDQWGYNYNVNDEGENVLWNEIKVMKFTKEDPFVFFYKISYDQEEFCKISVRNKRKKMPFVTDIYLNTLYTGKQKLSENKRKDLRDLILKKLIPNYYADFYNTIL